MLYTMGFVGRLDVHKGHGGSLALLILVMAEDFHALDSTKPGRLQKKNMKENVLCQPYKVIKSP